MTPSMTPARDMAADTTPEPPACPAPRSPSYAPSSSVPAGACDCHAHIFGPPGRYPYVPARRYTPASAGLDDYCRMLTALGIKRAVLVQPTIYVGNDAAIDATAALAQRGVAARAIVRLDASADASADAAAIAKLHTAGARGVRCHLRDPSHLGANELAEIELLAARIAPFGWHLQLHLHGDALPALATWLRGLPVEVVLDHFARVRVAAGANDPGYRTLLQLVRDGACWIKLSAPYRFDDPAPPYPSFTALASMLVDAAPDRLLWGSDWPHSSFDGEMPDDAQLLDALASWVPDADARRRILVDNPARLYGFDGPPLHLPELPHA